MSKLSVDQVLKKAKSFSKHGKILEAKSLYEKILETYPENQRAKNALHNLFKLNPPKHKSDLPKTVSDELMNFYNSRRYHSVISASEKFLKVYPNSFLLWSILGGANKNLDRLLEASVCFQKVTELNPNYHEGFNNLAVSLKGLGKFSEAINAYKKAIELAPNFPEVYFNLGMLYQHQGSLLEAETTYQRAIELRPNYYQALNNLGLVLQNQKKIEQAIEAFKNAVHLNPDSAQIWFNFSGTLKQANDFEKAVFASKKAVLKSPQNLKYNFSFNFLFPNIIFSAEHESSLRKQLSSGTEWLLKQQGTKDQCDEIAFDPRFNFSYGNFDNMKSFQKLSSAIRHAFPQLNFEREREIGAIPKKRQRLKIGFCSNHLGNHTIGRITRGIIENIDKKKFDVIVIHHPGSYDKSFWESRVKQVNHIILPETFQKQKEFISSLSLNTLIFPDIGMDGLNYSLAHCRFAPQQITSWGHPDTTGISTIDKFVSSALIEPSHAQQHYSEELILFSTLPSYYECLSENPLNMSKSDFGFSQNNNIYGCLQSHFKLHPAFDLQLNNIAQQDPSAKIIFIDSPTTSSIKSRWENNGLNSLLKQSIFLKHMSRNDFLNLMNICDVLLDPVYFGSGNTFYESAHCGVPVISLPGKFMRGRAVLGGYKQLQLKETPIAKTEATYAQTAVEWAKDKHKLDNFRYEVKAKSMELLFEDRSVIDSYETLFLETA